MADKFLKRAGLDYWDSAVIKQYANIEGLYSDYPESNFYYLTTKSRNIYTNQQFKPGDFFVFGPETRGLPMDILNSHKDTSLTIPMADGQRSLNLSNSVAVVLYEAIRQNG